MEYGIIAGDKLNGKLLLKVLCVQVTKEKIKKGVKIGMSNGDKIILISYLYDSVLYWAFGSIFLTLRKKHLGLRVIEMIVLDKLFTSLLTLGYDFVAARWQGMEFLWQNMSFFVQYYVMYIIFEGEVLQKIFVAASHIVMQGMLEFLIVLLFQYNVNYHSALFLEYGAGQNVGLSLVFCVAETVIICIMKRIWRDKRITGKRSLYDAQIFLWCIIFAAFSIIGISVAKSYTSESFFDTEMTVQTALAENSLLFSVLIAVLIQMIWNRRRMREEHALREELAVKEQYYIQLEENQKEIRKIRHDMKNQLLAIAGDVNPKKEIASVLQEIGLTEEINISGNPVVNIILCTKQKQSAELNIRWEMQLNLPEKLNLTTPELGILYGNLLDNAVEACRECDEGERYIEINSAVHENSFIIICRNSMKEREQTRRLFAAKKDSINHGIGLKSVRQIVEQHKGDMVFKGDGKEFSVELNLWLE